ncbi:Chromodomain-helicase-DNA-binding protein 3 [Pelomyxa schiedti]|nr:Chromodomain-helicase-DNA-binding protein 3 [Pelomyxa schiedti]
MLWYTTKEVSEHVPPDDCWVILFGNVIDVSSLLSAHACTADELAPLVENAGRDVSHWFDPDTHDLMWYMNPETGSRSVWTPMGRFPHVPPEIPHSQWRNDFDVPWWANVNLRVGRVSDSTLKICLVNTLTLHKKIMEVDPMETLAEIRARCYTWNSNEDNYTWKYLGVPLHMSGTLGANGVQFLDGETPYIFLYFKDGIVDDEKD